MNQDVIYSYQQRIGEIMNRLIGYARVSTCEQDLDLQINALLQAGCEDKFIFKDKVSGVRSSRPGLDKCIQELTQGDILVVWRLDRLGRSMVHLVNLIQSLLEKNIGFRSIQDGAMDTTTASGELVFNLFSALAQFERRLIQERTNAGLIAARARGKMGGRPRKSQNDPKVKMAKQMHRNKMMTIDEICLSMEISRATFYRYISIKK